MKALPLTATVLAAAVLFGARPGAAADLEYDTVPPPDRYGSAYEDPRYRDLYAAEPPPRVYRYETRPYAAAPPPPPLPPAPIYRGDDRFAGWDEAPGCLPRREIHRRLVDEGWHDFHDIELGQRTARVSARRPNGDFFRLRVDRCNGEIVRADVIHRGSPGPYAWRDAPRRFERPYY